MAKYTRAIVNCKMLHTSVLNSRLPRGTVVSGDDLAKLLSIKAEISEDPKSGAVLVWDPSSMVRDPKNVQKESQEAAAEVERIEKLAEKLKEEKQKQADAEQDELAQAASKAAENTEKEILNRGPKGKGK